MLVFEQYDSDTWGFEWNDLLCLPISSIVGTIQDALWIGHDTEWNSIKSRSIRAMIVLHNEADIDRVKI